jgi:transcription elongation factor/antiterminator RfaH
MTRASPVQLLDEQEAGARWYAVQALPSRERIATLNLERQGFETFVPKVFRRTTSRAGRISERLDPLFPGYHFVRLDLDRAQWRSVNGTFGVSRLVMFGDRPAPLARGFVEALLSRADERSIVSFSESFSEGDTVRVVSGPFDDLIGTLIKKRGTERVVVMMQLLSGSTPVELNVANLIRA